MRKVTVILTTFIFVITLFSCKADSAKQSDSERPEIKTAAQPVTMGDGGINAKLPDSERRVELPLMFPLQEMSKDIIPNLPDSRLPGAPRTYRGSAAKHMGVDFYTGRCGLPVVAPDGGWVIDLNESDYFLTSESRDSILRLTEKMGMTPSPILNNLHGISIVIYHGFDEKGRCYYSRMSHLGNLSREWKLGDYVERGEIVGYVGATGTSAQFRDDAGKAAGCHLHFELHTVFGGEDQPLAFNERDNDLKRKIIFDLFE